MASPVVSLFRNTWLPEAKLILPDGTTRKYHASAWNGPALLILKGIQSGKWKELVARYQSTGSKADKQALPCVTFAGVFPVRWLPFLERTSGLACLDYDPKNPMIAQAIRDRAAGSPFVFGAFLSPSGTGCKVLVNVGKLGSYAERFARAAELVDNLVSHQHDKQAEGESGLCYVSHDPDTYINAEAAELRAGPFDTAPSFPALGHIGGAGAGADVVTFTAQKLGAFAPGNRAAFLYMLACNCNRRGFTLDDALAVVSAVYDTDPGGGPLNEPARVVRNAYTRYAAEHGRNGYRNGARPS
jgi:VirE N-terminal domain